MQLETERLEIVPLTGHQLELLTEDIPMFEKELNCQYCGEEMKGIILKIFRAQVETVLNNTKDYLWHTFWLFKLREEHKFIGSACFKSPADEKGWVEIGYGINSTFQNQGYTTEAIQAMCNWALDQPTVTLIIAETDKANIPSQKVLEKCNMHIYIETNDCYWWQSSK